MNIPKTLKTTLHLYKTTFGELLYSNTAGMDDAYNWELLGTKEFELETPELESKELIAAKIEKLNKKREEILESKTLAINEIDDHLAQLAKIKD